MAALRWAPVLLLLMPAMALAGQDRLVGGYSHDFTEPADETVWRVAAAAAGYEIESLGSGERDPAWRLDGAGRAEFWERMMWPTDTAGDAECISWGDKPPSLADLFATPAGAAASPAARAAAPPGAGVLCRVEPGTRARISWLSDNLSDYFYYDPFIGVIEVALLPVSPAPSPAGAAP